MKSLLRIPVLLMFFLVLASATPVFAMGKMGAQSFEQHMTPNPTGKMICDGIVAGAWSFAIVTSVWVTARSIYLAIDEKRNPNKYKDIQKYKDRNGRYHTTGIKEKKLSFKEFMFGIWK
jgi:hypothetical protein